MDETPAFEGLKDPTDWLRMARRWAAQGRHEDALRAHVFYHRHALEVEGSQFGVRLSFALSDWARLALDFPPALDVLRMTRRDAAAAAISPGDPERFLEAVSIDGYLHDDAATYALIDAVEEAHPAALDDFVDNRTLDLLLARGEYRRALRWIVDPWRSFASQVEILGLPDPGIPDHRNGADAASSLMSGVCCSSSSAPAARTTPFAWRNRLCRWSTIPGSRLFSMTFAAPSHRDRRSDVPSAVPC